MDFRLTVARVADDAAVVRVVGELDLCRADELTDTLVAAENAGRSVVVDLGACTFFDSTTLGVLTAAADRLRRRGDELVLVSDDPRTLRTLEITGLDRIFRVERTLHSAIGDLAG
jgi:anti-sigma B factor antagonist